MQNKKVKILLDTDIGDDIDDAMTLALALRMPEVELTGITTVFAQTDVRARLAARMLECVGVSAPIYAGKSGYYGFRNCGFSQYEPALDADRYAPRNDAATDGGEGAVRFIVECARKYGKDLTIVAIGPLTNIAAAIGADRTAMAGVGKIALMGGAFYRTVAEWNILCDASAARTVFSLGDNVEAYGLDVTDSTRLCGSQFKRMIEYDGDDRLLTYLNRLTQLWHKYTGGIPCLHDPLTLYNAVRPGLVLLEPQAVEVLCEQPLTGITVNLDRSNMYDGAKRDLPRIRVGKAVADREFFEAYFRAVYGV